MPLSSDFNNIDLLAWLNEINLNATASQASQWQIHKIQLTQSLIQQDLPIKLIYHYERLDEAIKVQFPLNGTLLKKFNTPITREEFVNLPELAGLKLAEIAKPWQLKFSGKLVIFSSHPEVAIRLWWTNTLKDFELVYEKNLADAIEASFYHWQFVGSVEVIGKTPDVILTGEHVALPQGWRVGVASAFEPVPSVLGLEIQKLLNESSFVKVHWLPQLIDLAKQQGELRESDP